MLKFIKTTVIGGILFLLPLVLIVILIERALGVTRPLIAPLVSRFPEAPVLGVTTVTLAAAVALLVVSFFAGLAAQTVLGRRLTHWLETVVLARVPGYTLYRGMVGDLTRTLGGAGHDAKTRAVLAQFGEGWRLAFVVDELDTGELAVFVPGSPSTVSGALHFLPPTRVRDCGLTVPQAMDVLGRIGVGSSKVLGDKLATPAAAVASSAAGAASGAVERPPVEVATASGHGIGGSP
jgi:uncharacterized membrane protein